MIRFTIFRNARWLTDAGLIELGSDGYPSNLAASEFCGRVVAKLLRECPGCEWRIDQRSADAWDADQPTGVRVGPVIATGELSLAIVASIERAIATAQEVPA